MRRAAAIVALAIGVSTAAAAGPPDMAAVGVLEIGRRAACSGTLISPELVLTAGHCLVKHGKDRKDVTLKRMRFRTGAYPGYVSHSYAAQDFMVHPFYEEGSQRLYNLRHDAAIVRLAEPVPAEIATPMAVVAPEAGAEAAFIASYRGGKAERARERRCPILSEWRGIVTLTCDVRPGESGSPVLVSREGAVAIVGIVSASSQVKRTEIALAAEAAKLVGPLRAILGGG